MALNSCSKLLAASRQPYRTGDPSHKFAALEQAAVTRAGDVLSPLILAASSKVTHAASHRNVIRVPLYSTFRFGTLTDGWWWGLPFDALPGKARPPSHAGGDYEASEVITDAKIVANAA